MPERIQSFANKLVRSGLPTGYVERTVRELAEHRMDLKNEGLAAGLSETAAEAFADEKLGDLDRLAWSVVTQMRRASWWGRHRIISFCVLPVVSFFLWFALVALVAAGMTGLSEWLQHKGTAPEPNWAWLNMFLLLAYHGGMVGVPVWWCLLARRRFCGFKWAFIACGLLALHGLFNEVSWQCAPGGHLRWGYTLPAHGWLGFAAPLVAFGLIHASGWRKQFCSITTIE